MPYAHFNNKYLFNLRPKYVKNPKLKNRNKELINQTLQKRKRNRGKESVFCLNLKLSNVRTLKKLNGKELWL